MSKKQKWILTALCALFGVGTLLFYSLGCGGENGDDGKDSVNNFLECPVYQKPAEDGLRCINLEMANLYFKVIDCSVANPRPGENIDGRRLLVPYVNILIKEFIPNNIQPNTQQYVTSELGDYLTQVLPYIPIEVSLSKDGYFPVQHYIPQVVESTSQDIVYQMCPLWMVDGGGPPVGPNTPIIELTVVIETVDFLGDIQVETITIVNPVFNFVVDTIEITDVNSVSVDGDVQVGDITINDPEIVTNGNIVVDDAGDVIISGDDISLTGTGNTTVDLNGPSSLTLDGDVFVTGPVEIDDVTGQIFVTP